MVKVKCSPADIVKCSKDIKENNLSEEQIQKQITALIEKCSPIDKLPPIKKIDPIIELPLAEEFTVE